ncbi:hypothetical protein AB0J86_32955 [Micromonospora sp. NPDC049559]|uniref:hypothetical protein n=1 Tax=Micromonospora sp. NPDC049559 TaxID=3155923 RepID=UPI00342D33B5
MSGASDVTLISLPEIAELSGVRRPVVTTWRRRHADFPAPVDTNRGRPLFDAGQVVDWLVASGRVERAQIEPDLRLYLLSCLALAAPSAAVGARRRALTPTELIAAITALICLRHLDDEPLHPSGQSARHVIPALRERAAQVDWEDELLRTEIDALPGDAAWLPGVVDELVEAAWDCPRAYERVLAARRRFNVPALYADAVIPPLARLIAGLSDARERGDRHGHLHLADAAAGAGDLLMAVRAELGEEVSSTVVAAEPDPFLARITRRRLAVHGVPSGERRVEIGAHLPTDADPPDVLVVRLPYQPAEERGDSDPLAAVAEATDSLTPGQTAVVLGPAELLIDGLAPYRKAARTRDHLLRSGRVEAVVKLPGGVVPYRPGYQTALWVLRREDPSPWQGRVLLADVSDRLLSDEVVETLVWDITTWRRNGHRPDEHLRAYASQVKIADLVVPRRPLTARPPASIRDRLRDGRAVVAEATELEVALNKLAEPRPQLRADLGARDDGSPAATQPIGVLIRTGQFVLLKGARIAAADVTADGHHPVLGPTEVTGQARIGARRIDRGVLAERYPRVRLTEPEDLVVTMTPHLAVYRDEQGFSVVEFPARVLRVPTTERERFTPRVLAALLDATPGERAPGAVRAAARLTDLQVPILPPAEVARLDALLAAADARRDLARREVELLDELCRLAVSGVTDGKLTMTGSHPADGSPRANS